MMTSGQVNIYVGKFKFPHCYSPSTSHKIQCRLQLQWLGRKEEMITYEDRKR